MFEKAIDLDPKFAGGFSGLSGIHSFYFATGRSSRDELGTALRLAKKAVALDDTFGSAYGNLAFAYYLDRRHDEGLAAIRKAVQLAPSDALQRANYGRYLGYAGLPEEGIKQLRMSMRMNPDGEYLLYFLGGTYRAAGRYDKAIEVLKELRDRRGGRITLHPELQLAASYMQAGRADEARATVQAVLKVRPYATLNVASRAAPYRKPEDMERYLGALRKAGLPA